MEVTSNGQKLGVADAPIRRMPTPIGPDMLANLDRQLAPARSTPRHRARIAMMVFGFNRLAMVLRH